VARHVADADDVAVFEQLPVPLAVLDRSGAVVLWSARAHELWDLSPGRRPADLVVPASRHSAERLQRAAAAGTRWEGELVFRARGGDPMRAFVRCSPLRNATGAPVGAILAAAEARPTTGHAEQLARAELGRRIAQARKEAGLTQKQLAEAIGVTRRSIQGYEAGSCAPYRRLADIAAALDRPAAWFTQEGEGLAPELRLLIRQEIAELVGEQRSLRAVS
jgi:DNA-binding XRE family transcriptional regulator